MFHYVSIVWEINYSYSDNLALAVFNPEHKLLISQKKKKSNALLPSDGRRANMPTEIKRNLRRK